MKSVVSGDSISRGGGISVDQAADALLRGDAPFPAQVLSADYNSFRGIPYNMMSFDASGQAQNIVQNSGELFNRLFSSYTAPDTSQDELNQLHARRRSVLDFVKEDIKRLQQNVSQADRERLDQHFTAVRNVELQSTTAPRQCSVGEAVGNQSDLQQRTELMQEVVALALSCDLTRTVVFTVSSTECSTTYGFLGHNVKDHDISHLCCGSDTQMFAEMTQYKVSRFGRLVEKLSSFGDGGGSTLLDSSIVVGLSEMGDANHTDSELPVLVAGAGHSGGGTITASGPISNLWLTVLRNAGSTQSSFGNSTGSISGLWES
ncbi:MAG: DUF1552 domain-containing protein [Myxococcales bacterium]|nr:MAG: DUF1552 domain-containing protein [Myxococcales bacterium]